MSDGDATPRPIAAEYLSDPPLFPDIEAGGVRYVTVWDQADTTLIDLTSQSTPQQALGVHGFVYNIVQVR